MGFFESLCNTLVQQSADFATTTSAAAASAIVPVVVAAEAVAIFFYGLALLRGDAQNPVMTFVWRTFKVGLILAIIMGYSSASLSIIQLAWDIQNDMVRVLDGTPNAFAAIDNATIPFFAFIGGVLGFMLTSVWDGAPEGLVTAGLVLAFIVLGGGVLALCLFYALLAQVGLGLALGLGPFFIAALAFGPTARYFENWLSTILNFCLLAAVSAVVLTFATDIQKQALLNMLTDPLTIFQGIIQLILFGIVLMLLMMEVPRLTATLTGGADLTSTIVAYATMKTVYSPSWFGAQSGGYMGGPVGSAMSAGGAKKAGASSKATGTPDAGPVAAPAYNRGAGGGGGPVADPRKAAAGPPAITPGYAKSVGTAGGGAQTGVTPSGGSGTVAAQSPPRPGGTT